MSEKPELDQTEGDQNEPLARQTPEGFFSDLALPLKIIGYIFFGFAGIVLAMAVANMIWWEQGFSTGTGIALVVLCSIGMGFRKAANFLASGAEPEISKLAFWAFAGFGGAMVLVGILVAFDDPGGLFACAFGAVFIGLGFLARKLMRTPEGMKAVVVSGTQVTVSTSTVASPRVKRSRTVSIYVDENATEQEVDLAKTRWATQHWMARPDWVSGEIVSEASRNRGGKGAAAIVLLSIEAVMLGLALAYGEFWWFMVAVVGIVAAIAIGAYVHDVLHRRKFADSLLVLEQTPLRLGGELRAELRSGVPGHMQSPAPYKITLQCVHQWERTTGSGKDRRTVLESETLWQQEIEGDARTELTTHQCVPMVMQIPDDQPETSLGESREGNFWSLRVHLPLPGLDYRAEFSLPVLSPQTTIDPSVMPPSETT